MADIISEKKMQIQGKIIKALPVKEGTTERGSWMIATYVLETLGNYPKKMVFEVSGEDRIRRFNVSALMSGQTEVVVFFDIDAHEWQGKWFNQVRAYDIRPFVKDEQTPTDTAPAPASAPAVDFPPTTAGQNDDIPF